MVCPASTGTVVVFVDVVPSVCVGVYDTWYFTWPSEVLVRRTSDWNGPVKPTTCVTMGMISAFAGGCVLPDGPTGVTRLMDTGTFAVCPALVVTVTVPVFAPGGRLPGCAVTVRLTLPDDGTLPCDGMTARYGLSVAAEKVVLLSVFFPLAFRCNA